jgi:hypothetical protein
LGQPNAKESKPEKIINGMHWVIIGKTNAINLSSVGDRF